MNIKKKNLILSSSIYLSCQIFKDGSAVDGRCGPHAPMAGSTGLQVPMDTTHRELQTGRKWRTIYFWVKVNYSTSTSTRDLLQDKRQHVTSQYNQTDLDKPAFQPVIQYFFVPWPNTARPWSTAVWHFTIISLALKKDYKGLPEVQPSVSGTLLLPWLCHCLFLPCHRPGTQHVKKHPIGLMQNIGLLKIAS